MHYNRSRYCRNYVLPIVITDFAFTRCQLRIDIYGKYFSVGEHIAQTVISERNRRIITRAMVTVEKLDRNRVSKRTPNTLQISVPT